MSKPYLPPVTQSVFLLRDVLDWRRVLKLDHYAHVDEDIGEAVLQEGGRFAADVLAPTNGDGDRIGAHLQDGKVVLPESFTAAYSAFRDNGWPSLDLPLEVGGQQLPLAIQTAFAEMVNGANVSFGMLPIMQRAAAWLLMEHASEPLRERLVAPLVNGEWAATIGITEPQAGSDVGRAKTMATPIGTNGEYELSGSKIFITYADHDLTEQIIHLVLARTPDAPIGTRGISLFVVPKIDWSNDRANAVQVSRLEHKMGLRGSPTCALELVAAKGYLVGELHRGLPCLFAMVKLMRLEVAIQGVGVGQAALSSAWRYADERQQGGTPKAPPIALNNHPDVRRMLLDSQSRVDAARALIFEAAIQTDLARYAPSQEQRDIASRRANLLLPVCKAWGSEVGTGAASTAVQVYGGHGYVSDNGVEQMFRDSRVMAIYEGTNGIQAIDLVMRKVIPDEGQAVQELARSCIEHLDAAANVPGTSAVREAVQVWLSITNHIVEHPDSALAVATDYLRLFALVVGGCLHVQIATASRSDQPADTYRKALANHYVRYAMPEVAVHATRIRSGSIEDIPVGSLPPNVAL